MLINGPTVIYPEDAVMLDSKFVMDNFLHHLRSEMLIKYCRRDSEEKEGILP